MKRLIYLFVLVSLPAWAQLNLGGLFGGGQDPQAPRVQWNCKQQDYPQIKQIRNSEEVQIRFKEQRGELQVEFKPNIFKVQPFSIEFVTGLVQKQANVAVDYTECLARFQAEAKAVIEKLRSTQCATHADWAICQRSAEELFAGVERQIKDEKYFKQQQDRVTIPPSLPGKLSGVSSTVAADEIAKFCRNEATSPAVLYSGEALLYLDVVSKSLTIEPGGACLERYKSGLAQYSQQIEQSICPASSALCAVVKSNATENAGKVNETLRDRSEALVARDKQWDYALGIPEDGAEAAAEIRKRLDAQPFQCNSLNQMITINNRFYQFARFPKALAANMERLGQVADSDCLKTIIQNYAMALNNLPEERQDFKDYCALHNSDYCQKNAGRTQLYQANLRQLFTTGYGEIAQRYFSECEDCVDKPAQNLDELLKRLQDHRKAITCLDLREGESKVVSSSDGAASGLGGNYTLRRRPDGGHDVLIGVQINSDGQFGVTAPDMFQRVQSCIKQITPYMRNPSNGKPLNLEILSTADVTALPGQQRPRINQIGIQAPSGRSNSGSYEADIDCPTITHEVLHLLGLCDEYNGSSDGYGCRAAPKVASIMSHQNEAFAKSVAQTFTCTCGATSVCRKVMNGSDESFKKFYMMPTIYSATDYKFRNEFCREKELATVNWTAAAAQPFTAYEKSSSENQVIVMTQSMGDNFPKVERSEFNCSCPAGDDDCTTRLAEFKSQVSSIASAITPYCPGGSGWTQPEYGEKVASDRPFEWTGDAVRFVKKPERSSLLHTNQFERIVGGACADKAVKYNECAKWAYRGPANTNNCAGKPEYCDDDAEFLGASAQ